MTINKWPLADRPREKLLLQGAEHLTNAELIAIFLRTGVKGKTALDISRELLTEFGNLKKLLNTDPTILLNKVGVGKVKFCMLKAALELGKRYLEEEINLGDTLGNSELTKRFLALKLASYSNEVFACLFLDAQNRVLGFEELFHGTLTEANIYPREIIKRSLSYNAAKIIISHNHPSGNPEPSHSDREVTKLLKESLAAMDIELIDHIVIGHKKQISFAERGLI